MCACAIIGPAVSYERITDTTLVKAKIAVTQQWPFGFPFTWFGFIWLWHDWNKMLSPFSFKNVQDKTWIWITFFSSFLQPFYILKPNWALFTSLLTHTDWFALISFIVFCLMVFVLEILILTNQSHPNRLISKSPGVIPRPFACPPPSPFQLLLS